MSMEAFLINPARGIRRKRRVKSRTTRITRRRLTTSTVRRKRTRTRRGRGKGLPSALLRRMMKTYGRSQGMKRAWGAYRKGIRKNAWVDHAAGHRKAALKGWRGRRTTKARRRTRRNPWTTVSYPARRTKLWRAGSTGRFGKRLQKNPFGEEVMVYGMNPRRRRKTSRRRSSRGRRTSMLFNPFFGRRSHRKRRSYSMNRRRRHYRRNPARSASLPAISMRNPMGFLIPAAVGAAGYYVADQIPAMLNMAATPLPRMAIKAGIGLVGSGIVGRFVGKKNGYIFAIGAGINLVNDILRTYILKSSAMSGMGAFLPSYGVGAFPSEGYAGVADMSYPYEEGGYPLS